MNQPHPFALPRKVMTEIERRTIKMAADELLKGKTAGAQAMADLLDLLASWHGNRSDAPFTAFARRWVADGNPRTTASGVLLRDLFGEPGPGPRSAA
ncbi:hypothetical protein [Pseudomonas tohonis]|uniref:hypothetical protein n=1 Tax=Pseudomonas tohonis TaxID=2725477 RepID=UPI001F3D4F71|nr:hypothetical protein [Pseudomonas tohonis]